MGHKTPSLDTNERYYSPPERTENESPEADVAHLSHAKFGPTIDRKQKFLLAFQFAVFNLAAASLLGAAYAQGWVTTIVLADTTRLTIGIFAVFLGGLAWCARKIWMVSSEINCVRRFDPCRESRATRYLEEVRGRSAGSRAITGAALRVRLASQISGVRYVANSLVLLGLIGTVLGFVIALSGVDPATAGDVHVIGPMVSKLIQGMSVALYTTLVGAVLSLWLTINYHILSSGAVRLATDLVALGRGQCTDSIRSLKRAKTARSSATSSCSRCSDSRLS